MFKNLCKIGVVNVVFAKQSSIIDRKAHPMEAKLLELCFIFVRKGLFFQTGELLSFKVWQFSTPMTRHAPSTLPPEISNRFIWQARVDRELVSYSWIVTVLFYEGFRDVFSWLSLIGLHRKPNLFSYFPNYFVVEWS